MFETLPVIIFSINELYQSEKFQINISKDLQKSNKRENLKLSGEKI